MTRMEFFKSEEMKRVRDNISSCAIIGGVIAVGSPIWDFVKNQNYMNLITALIFGVLFLLIYFLQSRTAAILLTVFGGLGTALMLMQTGKPGGLLYVLFGVYGIIYTFKFQKAWKEHKATEEATVG